MDFENKAGAASEWNLGTGMSEMLTTALVNTGRFIVVERQAITDVIKEQDFGASGRTTDVGAAKIGKILNSQILVRGAVTEFQTSTSGGSQGFSYGGVSLGMSSSNAHVAVNIRLYDATTGQVIDSQRVAGTATASGASIGYSGIVGVGAGGFAKTPLGKATQQAIDEAVAFISAKMANVPWQGKIVKVQNDTVFINAGQTSNVLVGDEFTVCRKGEEMVDPDTGVSLGSEATKIGRIQVTGVEEKFSKAKATAGAANSFKAGDIIKLD
jgi:curli biogenesis system outer membrane secretion channel CsgG